MKILITEGQLKLLTELSDEFKNEVEIIYRDKNLVCMIPKTIRASKIYGKDAKWCQKSAVGFNRWSNAGLLIRFLFKSGRKIRFTYIFSDKKEWYKNEIGDFYWANENGHHVLAGDGDPFKVKSRRDRGSDIETDILGLINTIPEECKVKVLNFIQENRKSYNYCNKVSDSDYDSIKIKKMKDDFQLFKKRIKDDIFTDLYFKTGVSIALYFNEDKSKYELSHNLDNNRVYEYFSTIESLDKRLKEVVHEAETKPNGEITAPIHITQYPIK